MACRILCAAAFLSLATLATAQDDKIRIRRDTKIDEVSCIVKKMTCEEVAYQIEVDEKKLNQKESADNVEEIWLSKARKPVEMLQAEDEMDSGSFSNAANSWAKALADDDVKGDDIYKQVAMYKRAYSFYMAGKVKEAIDAYQALRAAVPDTYYLKRVFVDLYDCNRMKNDMDGCNKVIGEFEAEGNKRGKGNWARHAQLLRADLMESTNKHSDAQKIYAKYTGEKGEVGEEAQIGELRCLSSLKDYEPLRSKAESIIRDGKGRRSARSLTAAYNGLGEVLRNKDKKIKESMMAYLRGITEFQRYGIMGTREHETSLAMSAITMVEYGKTLPEEEKKQTYVERAAKLLGELQTRYQGSPYVKLVREALEKR
jgi:outer membrane protein assembly factor BamD (BamD/ComL family)